MPGLTHQSGADFSAWLGTTRIQGTKTWKRMSGVNPIKATTSTDAKQVNVFGKESADVDLTVGFDETDTPLASALSTHAPTNFTLCRGATISDSVVVTGSYKLYADEGAGVDAVDDLTIKCYYVGPATS